ncbi:uncharacterized protein LOC142987879 isoform X2 [Anticarsia gemmatalis]|uniref:uncharacterized protein LOC142987879 isoform X2 n=1 Tax=Anticarsia gemmatalis TaxID=129554 RepID=UPI003F75C7ED
MAAALLALAALLGCVCADHFDGAGQIARIDRAFEPSSLTSRCFYEGRWHASGATVTTRETCLRCVCARSALSCRRRACAPLPDPPPKRCYVRHRRGACCPELHCPDGIMNMEHEAAARFDDYSEVATPASSTQACVEGGTVYAAGSAMSSNVACEQCFCLKGARRCVRPTCLPPPPHCVPRPTPGACCPQRYYCDHDAPPAEEHPFDCEVDGRRVQEGDRVMSGTNCTACFCLKGAVRCQALACAPPLHGCEPIMRPGDCCAHQYKCEHDSHRGNMYHQQPIQYNALLLKRNDDRALHAQKHTKVTESTTKRILSGIFTAKHTPSQNDLVTTTKVKRKANDLPPSTSDSPHNDTAITNGTTTQKAVTAAKLIAQTTEEVMEKTTEQPEGTVKIVINGTINCTAELSSTSLPLSLTHNDTEKILMEALPRVPIVNGIEAQTYSPNDIITDRSVNGDFDENDTFTINVTSSLNANTNSTSRPMLATVSKIAISDLADTLNSSKKTKGDYDYDYTEPTLPPSLPNLKIIPFVAADAVVDDEPPKETLTYPMLEREDKFPVYYPADTKETSFTRREDTYHPTQYPVFISEKEPAYTHDVDLTSNRYPVQNDLVHEYTVSTSLGSHLNEAKAVTKAPVASSTFELETPAVNLFSPPVETEGGFIPKGPGIIDEYYAVYPSTPSGPAVPHLTTSMQLDISKGECTTEQGHRIPEGDSLTIDCSECLCTWGRLSCAPTLCRAPPGCEFKTPTADSIDQCCGDIVCKTENKTTSTTAAPTTERPKINVIDEKIPIKNNTASVNLQSETNKTSLKPSSTIKPPVVEIHTNFKPIEKVNENTSARNVTINTTKTPKTNNETKPSTTTLAPTTSTKPITKPTIPPPEPDIKEVNDTSSEYEDEDEDEGFSSFGSVLKYLLSDSYDSTTAAPVKKPAPTKPPVPITTTRSPPSTVNPFIPLPALPYIPPKISPATVNRIDHLVLGEATAIKRTTPKPITNKTTRRPVERTTERPEVDTALTSAPRPPNLGIPGPGLPVGAGLLKLAGCNIYGRMYRVGRIIAELSTPCQECWCTELGVQCKPLGC